jgi:hypothetical protein
MRVERSATTSHAQEHAARAEGTGTVQARVVRGRRGTAGEQGLAGGGSAGKGRAGVGSSRRRRARARRGATGARGRGAAGCGEGLAGRGRGRPERQHGGRGRGVARGGATKGRRAGARAGRPRGEQEGEGEGKLTSGIQTLAITIPRPRAPRERCNQMRERDQGEGRAGRIGLGHTADPNPRHAQPLNGIRLRIEIRNGTRRTRD